MHAKTALTNTHHWSSDTIGDSQIVNADCFDWLSKTRENSLHAIVTDPPYGVKEYEIDQLRKMMDKSGGVWRIPPSIGSCTRAPLPRFTALNDKERRVITDFFSEWSKLAFRALRPGAHVFMATNAFIANLTYDAISRGGLEFRGQLIRLVRTLRGGDRPKNAEHEFSGVSSMPRGCYEPWGIFRKPLSPGMTVGDCLRHYQTGGLRRISEERPFEDVILSERTPKKERAIADHPSLKPQSLMRRLVYASLPLGVGVVCDPFMGAGSTIAAANALGLKSIGIEKNTEYYALATSSIPNLSALPCLDFQPPQYGSAYGQRQYWLTQIS